MDYLTEIKPRIAIPVHDGLYAKVGMFNAYFEPFATQVGATIRTIDDGQPIEL